MNSKRQQFIRGMKAGTPIVMGFLPVAISYAIIARQAGMDTFQIALMCLMVFAGASQIMAAGMLIQGAELAAIIIATFLLNLRHIIMSTCVFEKMEPSARAPRLLGAYWVTDESFAMFTTGTKLDADDVSFDTLRAICGAVSIPVVAIGGISLKNIAALAGTGIDGIAVVSAIFAAENVEEATRELRRVVRKELGV